MPAGLGRGSRRRPSRAPVRARPRASSEGRTSSARSAPATATTCDVGSTRVEVELIHPLDVAEDVRELAGHRLDLVLGKLKPGQRGDVQYLVAGDHRSGILGGRSDQGRGAASIRGGG